MKRLLHLSTATLAIAAFALAGVASAAQPGSADLRIAKSDSPDPVAVNSQLTYTVTVDNLGPTPATGVRVTDRLPNGVELVSASGPAGSCSVNGPTLVCPIGSLAPTGVNYGGQAVTITVVVVPRRTGTVRNTATVRGDQRDPSRGNNRATATTTVFPAPTCRGVPATVSGTPGNDLLVGTPGPDVIAALGGNDRIVALAGQDLVCAGVGRDYIGAGTAADRVFAGVGRDRLIGRGGPDLLRGNGGNDVIKGGRGSDRLRGGPGFDLCRGGPGANSIRGCER